MDVRHDDLEASNDPVWSCVFGKTASPEASFVLLRHTKTPKMPGEGSTSESHYLRFPVITARLCMQVLNKTLEVASVQQQATLTVKLVRQLYLVRVVTRVILSHVVIFRLLGVSVCVVPVVVVAR